MQEHELPICSQPEVDEPELKDGEGLRFVAKCEVRPEITEVSTEGLKLYRDLQEVTDEQVETEITKLQRENSELQTPDPMRPAAEGDELIIDFEVSMDGEARPEMGTEGRPVEVGSGAVLDVIDEALAGMQPGESKSVDHTFDAEHPREEIRSKTATFEIKVRELRERIMPELDDEFAKDCGDYETLEGLRTSIREGLEEAATRRSEMGLRDQAVERLIDANDVTVPPSMIRQQQQAMMQELGALFQMGHGRLSRAALSDDRGSSRTAGRSWASAWRNGRSGKARNHQRGYRGPAFGNRRRNRKARCEGAGRSPGRANGRFAEPALGATTRGPTN